MPTRLRSPRPAKILLVDDAPDDLELFAEVLRRAGFRVTVATDGMSGYIEATAHRPDTIVADVMMPGPLDGVELTRKLGMNATTRGVPVIVLTANILDEIRQESFRAGAAAFLTKPCPPGTLLATLKSVRKRRPSSGHPTSVAADRRTRTR